MFGLLARIICTSAVGKNWASVLCSLEVICQISKKSQIKQAVTATALVL
jgi:hypothetical protein